MPSKCPRNRTRLPKLRNDKGRGFLELNGRRHYLGAFGAESTNRNADRLLAEWLANGRRLPTAPDETLIVELCAGYWQHAETAFRKPDGSSTSTMTVVRVVIREVVRLYGDLEAHAFRPSCLRVLRAGWVDQGLRRKTVNEYCRTVVQVFRWGASYERVPFEVHQALKTVEPLKMGRTPAGEPRTVRPVPDGDIQAVKPFVSAQVWALIELQLCTGARPGELLKLRSVDLDCSESVWTARLAAHKTAYRGRERVLYFNERAQGILRPFMRDRAVNAYLFSPRDAVGGNPAKSVREHYDTHSYRRAITRACGRAGVPKWTPHRLRHNAATRFREAYGLDLTAKFLGHSRLTTTQVYAEVDEARLVKAIMGF